MLLFFYSTVSAQDTVPVPQGTKVKNIDGFIRSKIRLNIQPQLKLYYGLSSPIRYSPSKVDEKFQLEASRNPVYGMGLGVNLQANKNTFGFEAALFQQEITAEHVFFEIANYTTLNDPSASFNFYKFAFRYGRTIKLNNKFELVPEFAAGLRYFDRAYFSQSVYFNQNQSSDLFSERYFNNTQNKQIWYDIGLGANVQRKIFKNNKLLMGLTTSFINRPFAKGDYFYNFNNQTYRGNTVNKLNYLSIQAGFIF